MRCLRSLLGIDHGGRPDARKEIGTREYSNVLTCVCNTLAIRQFLGEFAVAHALQLEPRSLLG